MLQRFRHAFVWMMRIGHCRGFGVQSPTDYWLVRYVINEHWPYYQYATLGEGDEWLTRKLGLLYFRLANWLQPRRLTLDGDYRTRLATIYNKVESHSVLIVEAIRKNRAFWREIVADERTGVTFDLYYCGIVMFDKKRHKQNYIINF